MKISIVLCAMILILCLQVAPSATALAGPDLVINTVDGPASVNAGGYISITTTLMNRGDAKAGYSYVKIYLSSDKAVTASDVYLGQRYISSLPAASSSTGRNSVRVPSNLAGGSYYIGAIADATDLVAESNESNNTGLDAAPMNIIPLPAPDLVVSSLTAPATAASGSAIAINCTVSNSGNARAGSTYVYYYLSQDAVITKSDLNLGKWYISSLSPGVSASGRTTVTIPAGTANGTYYVGGIADAQNFVAESNEANNTGSAKITIGASLPPPPPPQSAADLVVSSVTSPANAAPGSAIEINCTVSNSGNASAVSAYAHFYLSADTGITTADTYLGSWSFSALAPGASVNGKTTVTVPAGSAAGTYYIGAIADGTNKVAESNEGNNARASSSPLTITAPPPPPTGSTVQEKIAYYTNQERINAGKAALVYDTALAVVAQDHSSDMAINHFFDHTSPTNGTFATRLASHHYTFSYAGENIAMHSAYGPSSNPDTVARAFVQMWMGSSGHKANILNANYNRIGVGVAYGQGCYATQDFARK
jgi:uncharacterized protein YkwD